MPLKALGGVSGAQNEMVRFEGVALNTLFEELADWNHQLKHFDLGDLLDDEGEE